jgi:hypothetical protein
MFSFLTHHAIACTQLVDGWWTCAEDEATSQTITIALRPFSDFSNSQIEIP